MASSLAQVYINYKRSIPQRAGEQGIHSQHQSSPSSTSSFYPISPPSTTNPHLLLPVLSSLATISPIHSTNTLQVKESLNKIEKAVLGCDKNIYVAMKSDIDGNEQVIERDDDKINVYSHGNHSGRKCSAEENFSADSLNREQSEQIKCFSKCKSSSKSNISTGNNGFSKDVGEEKEKGGEKMLGAGVNDEVAIQVPPVSPEDTAAAVTGVAAVPQYRTVAFAILSRYSQSIFPFLPLMVSLIFYGWHCRLVIVPLLMLGVTQVFVLMGFVPAEERLMRLLICIGAFTLATIYYFYFNYLLENPFYCPL